MTDRELLELAAKAAGLVIDKSPYNGGGTGNDGFDLLGNDGFDLLGNAVLDWHNGVTWNPLTNDGDALRLAVKLRHFRVGLGECIGRGAYSHIAMLESGPDPDAATRRAIVRAAAEIGKVTK